MHEEYMDMENKYTHSLYVHSYLEYNCSIYKTRYIGIGDENAVMEGSKQWGILQWTIKIWFTNAKPHRGRISFELSFYFTQVKSK